MIFHTEDYRNGNWKHLVETMDPVLKAEIIAETEKPEQSQRSDDEKWRELSNEDVFSYVEGYDVDEETELQGLGAYEIQELIDPERKYTRVEDGQISWRLDKKDPEKRKEILKRLDHVDGALRYTEKTT